MKGISQSSRWETAEIRRWASSVYIPERLLLHELTLWSQVSRVELRNSSSSVISHRLHSLLLMQWHFNRLICTKIEISLFCTGFHDGKGFSAFESSGRLQNKHSETPQSTQSAIVLRDFITNITLLLSHAKLRTGSHTHGLDCLRKQRSWKNSWTTQTQINTGSDDVAVTRAPAGSAEV